MENFVQIKKNNIVEIAIIDENGNDTGESWKFDVEDMELPIRYNELIKKSKKNMQFFENEIKIIEKREDHKGKQLLSKNQEDIIITLNKYYKEQIPVYNMFLGENGVEKYLNGRKPYVSMFKDLNEAIESIMPILEPKFKSIPEMVKNKYSEKEDDVLE